MRKMNTTMDASRQRAQHDSTKNSSDNASAAARHFERAESSMLLNFKICEFTIESRKRRGAPSTCCLASMRESMVNVEMGLRFVSPFFSNGIFAHGFPCFLVVVFFRMRKEKKAD